MSIYSKSRRRPCCIIYIYFYRSPPKIHKTHGNNLDDLFVGPRKPCLLSKSLNGYNILTSDRSSLFQFGEDGVAQPKSKSDNIPISNGDVQDGVNGTFSGCSTPSTISPGEFANAEDESMNRTNLLQDQMEAKRLIRIQSNDRAPVTNKLKEM